MFKRLLRRSKKFMDERVEACKEYLSTRENRFNVGLVIFGLGVGLGGALMISAYIHVPA